jgi:hypothetical protein
MDMTTYYEIELTYDLETAEIGEADAFFIDYMTQLGWTHSHSEAGVGDWHSLGRSLGFENPEPMTQDQLDTLVKAASEAGVPILDAYHCEEDDEEYREPQHVLHYKAA